ncbi:MAG: response regulator [Pseudobdellovibrionaceae bacterium]
MAFRIKNFFIQYFSRPFLNSVKECKSTQELRKIVTESQSQSFLDSIVENIPNMIFVKEAETLRFVRFNKAGEELLGHSRVELIGRTDADFFPPEQAEFFMGKDRAVIDGGIVVDIPEEPIQTKYGTRYLHTKKIPIFDAEKKPLYLLGISEDITEKKIAELQGMTLIQEQVARAEAEKLAKKYAFLSEASGALNESLDYVATLEAFAKVVVNHFADWCTVDLLVDDEEPPRIEPVIVSHRNPEKIEKARAWRKKYPVLASDETSVPKVIRSGEPDLVKEVTDQMIREAGLESKQAQELIDLGIRSVMVVPLVVYGRVTGALSFILSEGPRQFDELDLSVALDLGKRVAFAIENARLFQKAQEANKAKSSFLANMSHEIRTPLGAMLGFAEMVSEAGSLSAEQNNNIQTIIRNGRQLLRIVDEILDLSKVESEKMEIEKIPFSLPQLIQEVTDLLRLKAQEKGLGFYVTPLSELPKRIVSDPTRLRQVLLNVIGNSIKFTEEGSVFLSIQLAPSKSRFNSPMLEFSVMDTGVGISAEQEKLLFQPFSQADCSTTRRFGGTGLGLTLSRKLARMLGGDLVLTRSSPGLGSTFQITIEAKSVEEGKHLATEDAPLDHNKSHSEKVSQDQTGQSHKKILVVDDAPDNRVLVRWYLDKLGYDVDVAGSGLESVERTMNKEYDLILMDIQMPGMDGFEALRQLRLHECKKPIIAVTAHAMKGDRERCLRSGFDDYLIKPIDRESLRESITRHLDTPQLH